MPNLPPLDHVFSSIFLRNNPREDIRVDYLGFYRPQVIASQLCVPTRIVRRRGSWQHYHLILDDGTIQQPQGRLVEERMLVGEFHAKWTDTRRLVKRLSGSGGVSPRYVDA